MPAVEVEVDAKTKRDIERMKKQLEAAQADVGKLQHPHKQISIFLDQWVQRNFQTEGGNVGKWPPFKHGGRVSMKETPGATSFTQRVQFGSGGGFTVDGFLDRSAKLLQDTGRLRLSFLPFADRQDAGIGSKLPYSKAHEEGKGVPKRRMLPNIGEVKSVIVSKYNLFLKQTFRKNGVDTGNAFDD